MLQIFQNVENVILYTDTHTHTHTRTHRERERERDSHLSRLGEGKSTFKIVIGKPTGSIPLGWPRRRRGRTARVIECILKK